MQRWKLAEMHSLLDVANVMAGLAACMDRDGCNAVCGITWRRLVNQAGLALSDYADFQVALPGYAVA